MNVAGNRRLVALVLLLGIAAGLSCDREDLSAFQQGEPETFTIEGLRQLVERQTAVGEERILAVGWTGRDQHARLIWSDRDGNVLSDLQFPTMIQPSELAACIEGANLRALVGVITSTESRVYDLRTVDGRVVVPTDQLEVVQSGQGPIQLQRVISIGQQCGLCSFDRSTEVLTCSFGVDATEQQTWTTGPLGDWSVLRVGGQLVLADWSNDDEGWVTVRITPLEGAGPVESGWYHSFSVGQLPSLTELAERDLARPRFAPMDDHIKVVFVDGTDWFTRLFVQRFSLDSPIPRDPELIESCRGTCKVRWVGRLDGATWIWFQDEVADWAERIDDSGDRNRLEFTSPPNVEAIGGGLFKMGLGNDIANWWALLASGLQEE